MHGGFGHFGAFGGLGWIRLIFGGMLMFAFLLGAILLIVWLARMFLQRERGYRYGGSSTSVPPSQPAALDIVQTRYAKGEITREEYKQMLEDLSSST